jgi:hypothetical protein
MSVHAPDGLQPRAMFDHRIELRCAVVHPELGLWRRTMRRNILLAVLIVVMSGPLLCADEDADKWLEFFVGDWTRE